MNANENVMEFGMFSGTLVAHSVKIEFLSQNSHNVVKQDRKTDNQFRTSASWSCLQQLLRK